MINRPHIFAALLIGTGLVVSACSVAPPMNAQETQIKADLAADKYMPATRQMRDAIETQELFAQAAFWSNEYHLNPGDLEAAIKLASAVRKMGNPGRAVEITQTTRALYPRDPYLLAEYAAALIASERSQDAISILDQGLSTTPSYGRLWSLKGAALDQQERYAEARQHYDRALRITPNDPNVMANIGLSHALAGDARSAEGWLRKAAAMPNASDSVRQNLILVLQLQGKTAEADRLTSMSRSVPRVPQMRQAYTPAAPAQNAANLSAQIPSQSSLQGAAPRARLQTGPTQGQTFKSASEAARAMAMSRTGQVTTSSSAAPKPATAAPPQTYPQAAYPQSGPVLAGGQPSQAQPERREPNRRRR